MTSTHLPRASAPVWPSHHDGKPLTRNEIATHDPALARRLAPGESLAAHLFDLGVTLNRAHFEARHFGLDSVRAL